MFVPVQMAVWFSRVAGAPLVVMALQVSLAGL